MGETEDPGSELPAIAGVYVETDRYRHLVGLERQVRTALDALQQAQQQPESIAEALRLALEEDEDSWASMSLTADSGRGELYQALSALIEMSGWKRSV